MNVETPDKNPLHLWPTFGTVVQRIIRELNRESYKTEYDKQANIIKSEPKFSNDLGHLMSWEIFEGFRSKERQEWLYTSGRTRPGQIITDISYTPYHGNGIAVDIVPRVHVTNPKSVEKNLEIFDWQWKLEVWELLEHVAAMFDMVPGGRWKSFPDTDHVQAPASWIYPAHKWISKQRFYGE